MSDATGFAHLGERLDKLDANLERKFDRIWEAINERSTEDTNQAVKVATIQGDIEKLEDRWDFVKWGIMAAVASAPIMLGFYHLITGSLQEGGP